MQKGAIRKTGEEIRDMSNEVFDYLDARLKLLRLEAMEKISKIISGIMSDIIVISLVLLTLIFLSATGGFALGNWLGSYALGFLIVSGFYLTLTIAVLIWRKSLIKKPILNFTVRNIFEEDDDE